VGLMRRWTALPASTDRWGPLQGVEGRSCSDLQASPWRMDLGLEQLVVAGLEKQLQRLKVAQLVEKEQVQKQDLQTGQSRWKKKVPPQLSQIDRLTVGQWQQQELESHR